MAGDCTYNTHYGNTETFCQSNPSSGGDREIAGGMDSVRNLKGRGPVACSPNFEVIDGLLYRKKLERGFINYREVLDEDRRREAICTFHQRRPDKRHHSLEETYKSVAENYWWEGMYFQIRDFVLGCPECLGQRSKTTEQQRRGGGGRVSKTMASHSGDMLSKLRSQREAGLFCDITLRTEGRLYSAHRAVLAAVSEYFQEIFMEPDWSAKTDVDLTGFGEESLLSLLDFSYTSTLSVHPEDLSEVSAMARHLGMWLAVEACAALLREQEQPAPSSPKTGRPGRGLASASSGSRLDVRQQRREKKGRRLAAGEDESDESSAEASRRPLRGLGRLRPQAQNGLPHSPAHRMKLMDFKSPSSKSFPASRSSTPRHCLPQSPMHTRLLRSTPGAAQQVQKLLPRPESPRRNKKSPPAPRPPATAATASSSSSSRPRSSTVGTPMRVKQEVSELGVDEEDYVRAQEKYRLMNVLGLQRTALLPRPEDLIGWRQKKRLRKLKANNYSLTKRRKPRLPAPAFGDVPLSLPLCNSVSTRFLSQVIKTEPEDPVSVQQMPVRRPRPAPRPVPPSDRSMRSRGVLPDALRPVPKPAYGGRELRRSLRRGAGAALFTQQPPLRGRPRAPVRNAVRVKEEPVDYSISGSSLAPGSRRGRALPHKALPPLRSRAGKKIAAETVRALRYNSGRPLAKARVKRNAAGEVLKVPCQPRADRGKGGSPGLRGALDASLRAQGTTPSLPPPPDPVPPPSLYSHPLYKVIKEEPADPLPVAGPFPEPPSPDLGKRQSKPPIKLLDPGFLFSFCRPTGGPLVGVKREEESVDICLMRSVAQGAETFAAEVPQPRVLRSRGGLSPLPQVKREREERTVSQSKVQRPGSLRSNTSHVAKQTRSKATRDMPKKQGTLHPLSSRRCVLLESMRRARLKQLRGPRSQAPKAPKAAHACLQCHTTYRDCDSLVMHRLRHIEGKHWPCPLCSKTFFRLRNVRNHIRTHDQKLYRCRSCMAAAS